ncbi:hypothetical protein GVAV_002517 [Gurleya vavrai]
MKLFYKILSLVLIIFLSISYYEAFASFKKKDFEKSNLTEISYFNNIPKTKIQKKLTTKFIKDINQSYSDSLFKKHNKSKILFNLNSTYNKQSNNIQDIRIYKRKSRNISNFPKKISPLKLNQQAYTKELNCQIDPFSNLSFLERQIKYKNKTMVYSIFQNFDSDFEEILKNPTFIIDSDIIINQPHVLEQLQTLRKIIKTKTRITGFNGCEYAYIFVNAGGILAIKANNDFSVFSLGIKSVSTDFYNFNNINFARCLYIYKNQIVNFNFYKCCDSQATKFSISQVFDDLIDTNLINLEFDECILSNLTTPIIKTIKNTLKKYIGD